MERRINEKEGNRELDKNKGRVIKKEIKNGGIDVLEEKKDVVKNVIVEIDEDNKLKFEFGEGKEKKGRREN